jgi:hypothetical protein
MKRYFAVALLFLTGCAVPVRPVARIVPDADGVPHFVPDQAQEPHAPTGLLSVISGALSQLGPMGQLGGLALTAAGAAFAGHAHGKKKAIAKGKKDEKAAEPKAA